MKVESLIPVMLSAFDDNDHDLERCLRSTERWL